MITTSQFMEIWMESGLGPYHERMDRLKEMGFPFDKGGDMEFQCSTKFDEYINGLIPSRNGVMDLTLEECETFVKSYKHDPDWSYD